MSRFSVAVAVMFLPLCAAAAEGLSGAVAAASAQKTLDAANRGDYKAPSGAGDSRESAGAGFRKIEYKIPMLGAPRSRVAGGTRGSSPVVLTVLAPDHVALTTSDQPTLYWYVSAPSAIRIELARVAPSGLIPLLEISVSRVESGIHAFSLKDSDVRLKPDEKYEWSVASLPTDQWRREVVSTSTFQLSDLRDERRAILSAHSKDQQAVAYAAEGIWHDALDALSQSISNAPERRELRNMRADLLEQAGLRAAAKFDRGAALQ